MQDQMILYNGPNSPFGRKTKITALVQEINLEENHLFRRNWGLFRDRRTDLYKELLSLDGEIKD